VSGVAREGRPPGSKPEANGSPPSRPPYLPDRPFPPAALLDGSDLRPRARVAGPAGLDEAPEGASVLRRFADWAGLPGPGDDCCAALALPPLALPPLACAGANAVWGVPFCVTAGEAAEAVPSLCGDPLVFAPKDGGLRLPDDGGAATDLGDAEGRCFGELWNTQPPAQHVPHKRGLARHSLLTVLPQLPPALPGPGQPMAWAGEGLASALPSSAFRSSTGGGVRWRRSPSGRLPLLRGVCDDGDDLAGVPNLT
jgi:hypothetical protein